jgi:hypothetical protein
MKFANGSQQIWGSALRHLDRERKTRGVGVFSRVVNGLIANLGLGIRPCSSFSSRRRVCECCTLIISIFWSTSIWLTRILFVSNILFSGLEL